jgi:NAD(P)-dependent dehydrogenase (short-subunit alcohol dehydrogenase family)
MNNNNNKTILVIAPGSGIGSEITKKLLDDGYRIIGIGGKSSKEHYHKLIQQNYELDFVDCDYYSERSIISAVDKVKQVVNKIDGMINFVGGSIFSKSIPEITQEDFRKVISLNLESVFLITRETYKWMKEKGEGNIILFGSTTGFKPSLKKLPYGVAKAGVHAMTWFFAQEGSQYNIITNTISPGYVMTERHIEEIMKKAELSNLDFNDIANKYKNKNPLKQLLYPEDIYPLVKMLLSTNHIQGQIFRIDSGQILG